MPLPLLREWRRDSHSVNGYHHWPHAEVSTERRIPALHIALFLATLVTTAMAGAFQQGANPFADPASLLEGLPFAATLMSILLFHEMGHYLLARVHGVRATLPYFIPGPPFFVGTFGAFIRMKSPPANRRALFDVGAAGPWAGVLLAVPAVILGLALSEVRPLEPLEDGIILGGSFLFSALTHLVLGVSADDVSIVLHPIALAGWFGLFVTFLNLLPVGQLDGGHVVYSLFGRSHRWISRISLVVILLLGFQGWQGWFVWVVLLSLLGVDHPPTLDLFSSLDPRRRLYGWCTVGLFVLTFIPVPITMTERPAIPAGEATPIAYTVTQSTTAGSPRGMTVGNPRGTIVGNPWGTTVRTLTFLYHP
jgi:membrane-associated protease RseP (regulator of RpoE activity)